MNTLSLAYEVKQTEIETFKSQKEVNKNELMANHEDHVQKLFKEIEDIQNENLLKRTKLEEVIKENDICKESLDKLEMENSKLKEQSENKNAVKDIQSLSAELEMVDPCLKNLNYVCNACDNKFKTLYCII